MVEESVYNLVPQEPVVYERPPKYRSTHDGKVKPTASTFGLTEGQDVANLAGSIRNEQKEKKGCAGFGRPLCSNFPDPKAFQKGDSKKWKETMGIGQAATGPSTRRQHRDAEGPRKPTLPTDKPILGLVSSKNYIVANAVETILAAPKKTHSNDEDFMNKDDFGTVPAYLQKIKRDIDAEYAYIARLRQDEEASRQNVRDLSAEDREHLIAGLKAKWEQVNHEYQGHTHLTKLDTVGKIKRKERCEADLSQLEKDIDKLKREHIQIDVTM